MKSGISGPKGDLFVPGEKKDLICPVCSAIITVSKEDVSEFSD